MTATPTAASLVERFKLKERGRERGQDGQPQTGQPTLDNVEMEVVGYCDDLYSKQRNEYHRHRAALEERLQPPPADHGGDPLVENTCKEMRDAVAEERPDLSRATREAQSAIGEVNRFRLEQGRNADADYPESRIWHWGILVALIVLESLINGLFFGANVEGGLLAGTAYAVLISVVNVAVLGWVLAAMVRQIQHRDGRRRIGGMAGLVGVLGVALFWNLFVAHYREALPYDYPPAPDTLPVAQSGVAGTPVIQPPGEPSAAGPATLAQSPATSPPTALSPADQTPPADSLPESCWRGPDESDADQEALCLFRASPFGLGGFYSYMLLLIGLAMCAAAAMDWYKTDDPYPGYGKRERHRRNTEDRLEQDRRELLADLNELHDDAGRRLRNDFRDPVQARQLALSDFTKLHARHTDLWGFARDLAKSCAGALDIYRNANREARSTPEPEVWHTPWVADWDLPEEPDSSGLMSEAEAEERSRRMHAVLEERERQLRDVHDECCELVNEFTRLDPHDKAVPA
ncbi:MAG: hypothetical protein OXU69_00940 [Gemmatimonadota bacterium]|nr:hypothetical protein [Acidobacteriota bacterium]MDE2983240.1 hypothetical protein [Gemmatimonadota bacterium]